MRKVWLVTILFGLLFAKETHAAIIVDHTSNFNNIPTSLVPQAAALRVMVRRASVGGNISDGLDAIQQSNSLFNRSKWQFQDRGNPGWTAKITDFTSSVNSNNASFEVMAMKFCFIDPGANFETYKNAMESLEERYPNKKFVWWTIPIEENSPVANRQLFNDQVRDYANSNNKILFDMADIESWDTSGVHHLSNGVETLSHEFSADGGHLNPAGERRVAEKWWYLMARMTGWNDGANACTISNGETNGDGKINIIDFVNWRSDYQNNNKRSDFNCDNKVDILDFTRWRMGYLNA